YAIAKMARNMGAEVTLVKGVVALEDLWGVTTVSTPSAQAMFEYFQAHMHHFDFLIKTAAVADYRAVHIAPHKIKKKEDTLSVEFVKNPDILAYLGAHKTKHQVVCGFAMESEHMIEHASLKKEAKHVDLIVANNIFEAGAGFATDTNKVTFLDHSVTQMPLLTKEEVAKALLMRMMDIAKEKETC
ncbi:MAG: phosphopantothenoylcysteine decarboxylase, partial [Erysipelotrichaceae bacterium]